MTLKVLCKVLSSCKYCEHHAMNSSNYTEEEFFMDIILYLFNAKVIKVFCNKGEPKFTSHR